ncbi:MAG: ABC transporter substrate-binding protein [Candidatus Scalindua sp.]
MKREIICILIVLSILFPLSLFAAGEKEKSQATVDVVEIKWLQWWVNEWGPERHAKLIADFEKGHPNIKVNVVNVPWSDMGPKLMAAAAGGGRTYDVIGIETPWISSLTKMGYLEKLDPWMEKTPGFTDSLVSTTPLRLFGDTLALSLYLIPYQFAYNVDVFREKGLEPPTNWEEFVAVLEALHDPATHTYGMSMTLQEGDFIITRYFQLRLAQEGGQWFDEDGKVIFNSPEGVAALQWWKDFYDKGLVVPGSMGEDQTMMLEFLASGKTVATIDGPFIYEKVKRIDPDMNLAYAPPWWGKKGGYSWAASGVTMTATSPYKEEAWEFLKYLYSEEVSVDFAQQIGYVWATKAGISWLEDSDHPMMKMVPGMANQDADNNVLYPVLPENEKLVEAFKIAFQETLSGKKDAKTALDEAAAIWQKTLDSAK